MKANIHKKQQDNKKSELKCCKTPVAGWLFRMGQKLNMEHMARYK
ncbi:hypothetical protein [Neptunicella marina]|nr:hypothetical protein [Neptunicella marina]